MNDPQRQLFDIQPEPWELDDAAEQCVATIVFSEGVDGSFDYLVPSEMCGKLSAGQRVQVPLGRGNRLVTGYCVQVENRAAGRRSLKSVQSILDPQALLSPAMLDLTRWMVDYYLCPWGRVLETVVPAAVRGQAGTQSVTFLSIPTGVAARITQLKLAPKQAAVLHALMASPEPLPASQVKSMVGCTAAPIRSLQDKGLIRAEVRRVLRGTLDDLPAIRKPDVDLNGDQRAAVDAALASLHAGRHETLLLHGVTGSGKTEVYIRTIQEVIRFGRQAIVLVPEISLTPQTLRRFRARFERVAVLHSHLSASERHWHWQRIARGEVQVVVGARSAVFAPTPHLGVLVLDEEHDGSFKQDTAPRYHAREVALRRARMEHVPLILGSATPSLESWQRATEGTYRLIDMPRRVLDRPLPHVSTIDLRVEYQSRYHRGAISRPLYQAISEAIRDGGQVILLLNRRGFSTHIQCPACGKVVTCRDCDIALTHHREENIAVCHYCDFQTTAPPVCPECGFEGIRYSGLGTQRLEAEVRSRFTNATCLRMDSDAMKKPGSHERALASFRQGEIQILLGTQMIAKGLDFPNVTLVGVINADTGLHLPDFRAAERTFQLVTQVAGRTGRGEHGGRVLVQTFSPDHYAIETATRHDFLHFARIESETRRSYGYPPYGALVRIILRGEQETKTRHFAELVAEQIKRNLKNVSGVRILGPASAPIAKLRGRFRFHILLQSKELQPLQSAVRCAQQELSAPDDVQWVADVDPLEML